MFKDYVIRISKDTFTVFALNAVNYLGSFALAVLVSRSLGLESFGEYSLIFGVVLILGIVSDFGLSTLLVRKINEHKSNTSEIISLFNRIKAVLSVSIIVAVYLFVFIFAKKFFIPAFLTGVLIIFPRSLQSTYDSSLRAFGNQMLPAVIKGCNSILQLVCGFIILSTGGGLEPVFIILLGLDVLTACVLRFAAKRVIDISISSNNLIREEISSGHSRGKLFSILKESSVFFTNNFFMLSIKSFNLVLLGYFATSASVGIYSAGSKIVNGIGLLSGALFNSFYPMIANIKNDLKLKRELTKQFVFYAFTAGAILTVLVFFLSGFLIEITFKTPESVLVLKILSFTVLPILVYTITQSFLFTTYNEKFLFRILLAGWILNIVLSVALIGLYDYTGCAVALSVTEIFLMLTQLIKFNSDSKNLELQKATLT